PLLEKLALADGKILFLDVPFTTFTFIHHIEDLVADTLPFALYNEEAVDVTVRTISGDVVHVRVGAFSTHAVQQRNARRLQKPLAQQRLLRRARVGNTTLQLVRASAAVRVGKALAAARPL